jgi:hypothetical protein
VAPRLRMAACSALVGETDSLPYESGDKPLFLVPAPGLEPGRRDEAATDFKSVSNVPGHFWPSEGPAVMPIITKYIVPL